MVIHGAPKSGKSTLASQAPKPLFLATEPGLAFLPVYETPIASWADLLDALAAIARNDHDFESLVVDTIDLAYHMCSEAVCAQHEIKHPADLKYGKGFALVNNEFRRVLTKMTRMVNRHEKPLNCIFISHTKHIEMGSGEATHVKAVPTLPTSCREVVCSMSDFIFYMDLIEKSAGTADRVIRTKGSKHWEAGDRTGKLPHIIPQHWEAFASLLVDPQPAKKGKKKDE